MISPTKNGTYMILYIYIYHSYLSRSSVRVDIPLGYPPCHVRGVAGLGRRPWPEAEGTLAAAVRTQLGSGIFPPNIGDFTNKNGD